MWLLRGVGGGCYRTGYSITCDWLSAVTPTGAWSNPPKEDEEGDAGFALMLPSIEGVNIKPFHFCKKTISMTALREAGE